MTLVGFAILVIIAALVITHSNKSLPPPVVEEEPVVEPVESQKPSLTLVVFWLFILMATIALGLCGIWLNV
jgi:hypothetical protein